MEDVTEVQIHILGGTTAGAWSEPAFPLCGDLQDGKGVSLPCWGRAGAEEKGRALGQVKRLVRVVTLRYLGCLHTWVSRKMWMLASNLLRSEVEPWNLENRIS